MIELRKNHRRVVQAVIGLDLRCTSGNFVYLADRFVDLAVNPKRRFGTTWGPDTVRNDDGTTSDWQGSISGSVNRARSRVSGRWYLKITFYDNAGVLTDTCSTSVSWTAKQ